MKIAVLLLAGTLAACSEPLPVANNATAVEVNGVEEVMPSEGEMMPDAGETDAPDANATTPVAAQTEADYLGRWTGVEGMFLTVSSRAQGGVQLAMQWDLDNRGTFEGSVTAEGLRFMRNGVAETAVPSDGDATGLKYLAGKRDCLTVKSGEGYCRD